jgi:hypothetical protein
LVYHSRQRERERGENDRLTHSLHECELRK